MRCKSNTISNTKKILDSQNGMFWKIWHGILICCWACQTLIELATKTLHENVVGGVWPPACSNSAIDQSLSLNVGDSLFGSQINCEDTIGNVSNLHQWSSKSSLHIVFTWAVDIGKVRALACGGWQLGVKQALASTPTKSPFYLRSSTPKMNGKTGCQRRRRPLFALSQKLRVKLSIHKPQLQVL